MRTDKKPEAQQDNRAKSEEEREIVFSVEDEEFYSPKRTFRPTNRTTGVLLFSDLNGLNVTIFVVEFAGGDKHTRETKNQDRYGGRRRWRNEGCAIRE